MPWGETWMTALWQSMCFVHTHASPYASGGACNNGHKRVKTGHSTWKLTHAKPTSEMWISSDTNHKVLLQETCGVVKTQNDAQRTTVDGLSA